MFPYVLKVICHHL